MKRCALLLLVLSLLRVATAQAQETINLTVPIARASITSYTPVSLDLRLSPVPHITVEIRGTDVGGATVP